VIAVAERLRDLRPDVELLYVGTRSGPERSLVAAAGIPFAAAVSGRLRRYVTWRNAVDPWLVLFGVAQAASIIRRFRPAVAFGAGGFATVPPLLAARLAGARVAIHQQDVIPSLANRMLAPFATRIFTAFEASGRALRRSAVAGVGNPVRRAVLGADAGRGRALLGLETSVPAVLAMGGGTGALGLNRLVAEAASDVVEVASVVHLTGAAKAVVGPRNPRYRQIDFLAEDFPHVLAAADVVISRAGMSSLAEMAALRKSAVVVPMPGSHQEANAAVLLRAQAAVVKDERSLSGGTLRADVRSLLVDNRRRQALSERIGRVLPGDAAERIAGELLALGDMGA
jgi:UDP-N-acetylglucosamine--N-acetylmuramyl-(pentapeptide) pyrophosphoryl-undecaprenol N-acetylglucosamine transferase